MLDQDSESYELVPDYKNFKCDFLTHEKDYVMWQRFRWYRSHPGGAAVPVEPTLKDLDINRLQLEFYLSHEPTVQTLFNMDVHMFDIHSSNYRLEAIVMFALALVSIMVSVGLCCHQNIILKQAPTLEQQAELTRIKQSDPMDSNISNRR